MQTKLFRPDLTAQRHKLQRIKLAFASAKVGKLTFTGAVKLCISIVEVLIEKDMLTDELLQNAVAGAKNVKEK